MGKEHGQGRKSRAVKRWAPRLASLVSLLVLVFLTTGCAEQPDAAQPRPTKPAGEIIHTRTVGQTFVATADNLSRIDLLMASYARRNHGPVVFCLRESTASDVDIVRIEIEAGSVKDNRWRTFRFEPIRDSGGRSFYLFLESPEATPGNAVTVWQSARDVYLDGNSVIDGLPGEGDLAFRLYTSYRSVAIIKDAWKEIWRRGGILLLAMLIFGLPGLGLLVTLPPQETTTWRERLLAAPALTLAFLPLLFLLTKVAGLRLGAGLAWGPAVLGIIALAWRWHKSPRRRTLGSGLQAWWFSNARWPDLALVATVILIIVVRLLAIRDLTVPSWGDSVQHAVMTQLMVDNGGLFDSWLPYAPYQTLTVHFGFATAAAVLQWITGLEAAEATLVAGQVINVIAVLALYPLAVRIGKGNRWSGVAALLVAGLLSPMPAFYVNWGRYAQLIGQAVLPVAIWFLWRVTEADQSLRQRWKELLVSAGAVAGMTLSYYRMPFFYAAFVLAWLLFHVLPDYRWNAQKWAKLVARLALVGIVAGVFLLPWLSNIAGGELATGIGKGMVASAPLEQVLDEYRILRDIPTYVSWVLVGLSAVAGAWATIRRQWTAVLPAAWALVLVALPAGRLVHLPGANYMQLFAALIALYIPVSLLIGWLVGRVAAPLGRLGRQGLALVFLAFLLAAVWGGRGQITVVQPFFRMVFPADEVAMRWIQENTPPDARFLVNGFLIYYGYSSVGSDAGWWIPLLTQRANTMPPQYALLNEKSLAPGYTQAVTQLVTDLQLVSPTSPEGLQLLCQQGITHAYVGQGRGMVSYEAVFLLPVQELMASPSFELIYQQDQVKVFALDDKVCSDASVSWRGGED